MRELVIYHGGCFDGFAAAWLFSKAFPDAEFVPAQYGQAPPDVRGRDVYIADFSYKLPAMMRLASDARSLTVLDHHQTARAELEPLAGRCRECGVSAPSVTFDMGKSGGRLAWEFLYGSGLLPDDWLNTGASGHSRGVAPWLVDYTEDRDLWRWALPQSREINAALRSYPTDFAEWDHLHAFGRLETGALRAALVQEGAALLRAESQVVAGHVRHAREIDLDGHKVLAVNATTLTSEVGGELAKGRPFGATWFDRADGCRVWSLRSEKDGGVDVSEVAKRRGGGGHKNAAGYEEPGKGGV